jgi:hypothetical protein
MRRPRDWFTMCGISEVLAFILVLGALTDIVRNHRRVIRLQAAWSYDTQDRECLRLADAYLRAAVREADEAGRWPEGSERRSSGRESAAFNNSQRGAMIRMAVEAHEMARKLRRLGRVEE